MNVVVPGAMRVMKWMNTEIARAIRAGADEIRWTTPSGFNVKQRLMKTQVNNYKNTVDG